MRKILLIIFWLSGTVALQAQTRFFGTVKIEYERTVYVKQLYKEVMPDYYEQVKDRLPEKSLTYSDFTGDTTKSVYKPGREVPKDPRSWYEPMAEKNTVYTDYRSGTLVSQKPVFEETFLVTDSLPKIRWKLTPDTRTIAGFECHKAMGILHDSIAVFAFYTDEILVPGGPESIQGLPGMILGMSVPRLHTTWFATRVEATGVDMSKVAPATKGKKTNYGGMMESLENVLKEWGKNGKYMMMNFAI